ncbi:MAG: DUF2283 domain-containing protein [Armatimonadetes bacterium]|nr:DUF2283 domain-containing protein [Armatimonadota bacterium]
MKCQYYPETDSLYIDLVDRPSAESQEVRPGVVLDFDADGKIVGIDIDNASKVANLTHFEIEALPAIPLAS